MNEDQLLARSCGGPAAAAMLQEERLTAFELALRDADIEQQHLVTVSSILPPGCNELERQAGVATLQPGEITFAVMARCETNEPGRRINSSIGLARPSDPSMYGYISEHHGYGMGKSRVATTPRTSRQPCWLPLSGWSSIRMPRGDLRHPIGFTRMQDVALTI